MDNLVRTSKSRWCTVTCVFIATLTIPGALATLGVPPTVNVKSPAVSPAVLNRAKPTAITLAPRIRAAQSLSKHLVRSYGLPIEKAKAMVATIYVYAEKHKLEPHVLLAVVKTESMFDTEAVSPGGAMGLMQVMPDVHESTIHRFGGSSDDLLDGNFNIRVGAFILGDALRRSRGNLKMALALYNGTYGKPSGYPEKVLRASHEFKAVTDSIDTLK